MVEVVRRKNSEGKTVDTEEGICEKLSVELHDTFIIQNLELHLLRTWYRRRTTGSTNIKGSNITRLRRELKQREAHGLDGMLTFVVRELQEAKAGRWGCCTGHRSRRPVHQ